jgi:hypothetical protein
MRVGSGLCKANHSVVWQRMMDNKHRLSSGAGTFQRQPKKRKIKAIITGSGEDILLSDIKALIRNNNLVSEEVNGGRSPLSCSQLPYSRFSEIEIEIQELSSLGIPQRFRLAHAI